jgi:hypothetical protein
MTVAALLCIASVNGVSRGEGPTKDPKPAPRSLTTIQNDVRAALRTEAVTWRAGDNAANVVRLVELYREMAAHPQRETSPMLKELGLHVRARLVTVRDRIERRLGDSKVKQKTAAQPDNVAAPENRVLAQQMQPGNAAAAGAQAVTVTGTQSVTGVPRDLGPELVDLIQATISPATWRINGGPSAIVYFAPRQALVVSAPDEIHARVGGVLQQLNAAQRKQDGAQVVGELGAVRAQNR